MRGLAQVTVHRDARRDDWHTLIHPPCAAWSQVHRHPGGAVRRSIPVVSAADPTAATAASDSARTERSKKRVATSDRKLRHINES